MEKQKKSVIVRFSVIAWCIPVILLFPAPCGATDVLYGETLDVGYGQDVLQIEDGYLFVDGTLNLYPGADVGWIYAFSGSTVNIYGGDLGVSGFVLVFSGDPDPDPVVTVYGTDFALDDAPLDPLVDQFFTDSSGYGVLTGTYGNGDLFELAFYSEAPIYLRPPHTEIAIDIKPGNDQNNINLKSKGIVQVAVLTTANFDADMIDPATALFAGAEPVRWKLEDVDDDGDDDMIFHLKTQDLDLDQDSTEATLTAQLLTQESVFGTDEVRIVPSKKK